ncbi:hypothetical protein N7462_004311 [Penicillium macrosclerotiorum]|uniref:uncharacterized protein n=1 Tax=Penicillium macrosclerotiorum TaxID=303699 RepID=UPI002547271E|nr:uncharacterized protein N7462_004311 [Penicillium macrosclerotiorum]KAJ5689919.1 hypothetical protein N7462_004311 [Penicillium macrosclerotiorum]
MSTENGVTEWEASFEKNMELLRLASTSGNVKFLSIYQEKMVETTATEAGFLNHDLSAMDVRTMIYPSDIVEQLRKKNETAVKEIETSCTVLRNTLQDFKESYPDAAESDWKSFLDEEVKNQKNEGNKRWDDLKHFGVDKIKQLPESLRSAIVQVYSAMLVAIAKLTGNIVDWLRDATNKVTQFIRMIMEKIKEFAGKVVEWCSNTSNLITSISGDIFSLTVGPQMTSPAS